MPTQQVINERLTVNVPFSPHADPNLEQGMPLPIRMAAAFTPDMANIPLEDFDPYFQYTPVTIHLP
jgi:hypothetical protein